MKKPKKWSGLASVPEEGRGSLPSAGLAFRVSAKSSFLVVLICISLRTKKVEQISMFLVYICFSSCEMPTSCLPFSQLGNLLFLSDP